jgi:hypothetical protein
MLVSVAVQKLGSHFVERGLHKCRVAAVTRDDGLSELLAHGVKSTRLQSDGSVLSAGVAIALPCHATVACGA